MSDGYEEEKSEIREGKDLEETELLTLRESWWWKLVYAQVEDYLLRFGWNEGRVLQTVFAEDNLYARETVSCQVWM